MGGGGHSSSPAPVPPPTPIPVPTKDVVRVQEDKAVAELKKRGRKTTVTGASGEPGAGSYADAPVQPTVVPTKRSQGAYAPTNILVASGTKKTTGA